MTDVKTLPSVFTHKLLSRATCVFHYLHVEFVTWDICVLSYVCEYLPSLHPSCEESNYCCEYSLTYPSPSWVTRLRRSDYSNITRLWWSMMDAYPRSILNCVVCSGSSPCYLSHVSIGSFDMFYKCELVHIIGLWFVTGYNCPSRSQDRTHNARRTVPSPPTPKASDFLRIREMQHDRLQ